MSLALQSSPSAAVSGGERSQAATSINQFLTFILENRTYAVPLPYVAEICVNRALNRLPHMPKGAEGLLDVRGRMIPVVNLRVRLGLTHQDAEQAGNILILQFQDEQFGILVDKVDAVLTAHAEDRVPASPFLAGPDGFWITDFILQGSRVLAVLAIDQVANLGGAHHGAKATEAERNAEHQLDDALAKLIESAPEREAYHAPQILPQMEASISYTEQEMDKVIVRIEGMLAGADSAFQALTLLKQEMGMGRMKGQEANVAELESGLQSLQEEVFKLLHMIQFQDIARQKLERVMNHIRGLQVVIGTRLRDTKR